MQNSPPHPLQIVNASAGSGKTYSLVKTYLKIILTDNRIDAHKKYSKILAMTFTNKAAIEMKTRIIKALEELAFPISKKNNDYLNEIAEFVNEKVASVSTKARFLLSNILHHYEDFYVMTIDKFNLRLIRSFNRDLDIPSDFNVVLDAKPVLEQVVDLVIGDVGKDEKLSNFVLHFVNSSIEDDEQIDVRKALISFAEVLVSEKDISHINRLMNLDFSNEEYAKTKNYLRDLNEKYQQKINNLNSFYTTKHLSEDNFPSGKNVYKALEKLSQLHPSLTAGVVFTPAVVKALDELRNINPILTELSQKVSEINRFYHENVEMATVISKFLKNYFEMALLQRINRTLVEFNKKERQILISDFNPKVAQLLSDDTLYIYEKLGVRFEHFMLDEFQDTSRLQWINLVPLIRESLGNGLENFIVGDPKQAIYRFKNGLAEQFVELPQIYNPENDPKIAEISQFFNQMGKNISLEDNWRSNKNIVFFNTKLFELLRENLHAHGKRFYESVKQTPKTSIEGLVHIESKKVNSKSEGREEFMPFILDAIQACLDDGYLPGDICILSRSNDVCNLIANELTKLNFNIVSADSLNIDSETTVKFVLSYFNLRLNPFNSNLAKQFFNHFCNLFKHDLAYYNELIEPLSKSKNNSKTAIFNSFFQKNTDLVANFFFHYETLYDLLQKTYALFGLNELENPYLHHFSDLVFGFELRYGPDLSLFLQHYPTMSKDSKSLQIAESDDAIQVMTIHKSKGLEFPIVITIGEIPRTTNRNNFFIESNNYLFRSMLKKDSPVKEISIKTDEENQQIYLDDLNLLYVSYTRPVNRLYALSLYKSKGLNQDLHNCLAQFQLSEGSAENIKYIVGNRTKKQLKQTNEDFFFEPKSTSENLWFPNIALQDEEKLLDTNLLTDEQRYGNQFHEVISEIHSKAEIYQKVESKILSGKVELKFKDKLIEDIQRLFKNNNYTQLFTDYHKILNEQNFIISEEEQLRPDKIILKKGKTIILDYKTGQKMKKHQKQVEKYHQLLENLDFPKVESYLFYTKEMQLVQVC